jgi:hypothetical protein
MSGLPTWKRVRTIRGTTCHEWDRYTIEKDGGKCWLYVSVGGGDVSLGTHPSFMAAKEAAYDHFES